MINTRWLFVCSCIALITSAFTFSLHGDVMQSMGAAFNFSQRQNGDIGQAIFFGMAFSMLFGGFVCDALGIKSIMFCALASHLAGSLGMVFSKQIIGVDPTHQHNAYWWLYASGFIMGCGNGFTEVGINPLVATMYPRDKTHYLNILHAWWPGGLIIGGTLALAVRKLFSDPEWNQIPGMMVAGLENWQFSLILIAVPAVVYGIMLVPSTFPATERVQSGVSTKDMLLEAVRPMFLLWAFCMLLTASTELGPQKWQESVMQSVAKFSGTAILMYTSGLMFVLRHFAGPLAHRLSPVGLLIGSSVLSATGLYLLSTANSPATAIAYATIFGLGIAYYWPTMLGVSAERFPKGGALILALMGSVGNLSIGVTVPAMGQIVDYYSVERLEGDLQAQHPDSTRIDPMLVHNENGETISLNAQKVAALKASTNPVDVKFYDTVIQPAQSYGFSMAFRWVSVLPAILVFIFAAIAISDKRAGGYKAVSLESG